MNKSWRASFLKKVGAPPFVHFRSPDLSTKNITDPEDSGRVPQEESRGEGAFRGASTAHQAKEICGGR